ncbi:MAG TPA: ferritin-like domain-containing protein [Candidatus Omnitrophota bacterium]|nr:ferritin-like domain-containing protein [Candidatus Omnitrophota bacterium]
MGEKFRKTSGIDIKDLINDLNKAYCDEWLAFYAYTFMAQAVSGAGYEDMQEFLEKLAKDELEHQDEVADMIIKLGGVPVANFADIEKSANFPYPMPPKEFGDYGKIIQFVLDAEGGAIEVYRKIAKKTFGKEDVVYQLVTHILTEEVEHEEMFENLK